MYYAALTRTIKGYSLVFSCSRGGRGVYFLLIVIRNLHTCFGGVELSINISLVPDKRTATYRAK